MTRNADSVYIEPCRKPGTKGECYRAYDYGECKSACRWAAHSEGTQDGILADSILRKFARAAYDTMGDWGAHGGRTGYWIEACVWDLTGAEIEYLNRIYPSPNGRSGTP